jgi:hypothetical protein
VPDHNHPVEVQNLRLQHPQLPAERSNTRAHQLGQSLVINIGNDMKQFLHTMTSDRCDNAKLGKMGADRIDHRRLLTDQKMARAMQHQATLLLSCLGRHKAHVGPADRLADGLSVSSVVLMPLDVRPHIGRRHQPNGVAKGLKLA